MTAPKNAPPRLIPILERALPDLVQSDKRFRHFRRELNMDLTALESEALPADDDSEIVGRAVDVDPNHLTVELQRRGAASESGAAPPLRLARITLIGSEFFFLDLDRDFRYSDRVSGPA